MLSSLLDKLDLRELGGELLKIRQAVRAGRDTCVFSATPAIKAHIAWGLDKFVLYVCEGRNSAYEAFKKFEELLGEDVGLIVERDDLLLFKQVQQKSTITNSLKAIYNAKIGKSKILVITIEALMQYYPSFQFFEKTVKTLKVNDNCNLDELANILILGGYSREEVVETKGSFAINGDILSVFAGDADLPIRISFWDNIIESIKMYDVDTMMSVSVLTEISILPISDFVLNSEELQLLIEKAKVEIVDTKIEVTDRNKEIIDEVALGNGVNWLMPYASSYFVGIENYLPKDTVVCYDEPKVLIEHAKSYYTDFINRYNALLTNGEVLKSHKKCLRKLDTVLEKLDYTKLAYSLMTSSNPIFAPKEIYKIENVAVTKYFMNFTSLYTDIKNFNIRGFKVILCCGDENTAQNIRSGLFDENIYATYADDIKKDTSGVIVTPFKISNGFIYSKEKIVLIGRDELIRKRDIRRAQKKKTNVFTIPKCGDYVVHEVHGIGLCAGVERIKSGNTEKDYVMITYSGTDKLYVPIDQMDRLQRYGGNDKVPKLSKIGGKDFFKLKERVKKAVREMAFDLLQLYSKRQQCTGFKYSEDTIWQKEFEDSFEYAETEDQLRAVAEIKSDMEKGIVMDRLLCGDVGYGKTEVAFRAVFKTVMDGKQAAIVAPTTILARQHYNTAMARFNEQKFNCVLLSRFQSKEEIKVALDKIQTGVASVIIATHRILSSDVVFKDLGLLVLDEEQRFGVEHKDKIKTIKTNINVLTLSATPIPRTLNMALTGVRDISLLETPPIDRLPVQTAVTEMTDSLLEDSIRKELARDGQVFVLFNRVMGIEKIANKISELVPEAKVIIGHGQMGDSQLEDAINKIYSKEANVFVCTTIIENGIDLPDANTLIVCDADKLGLSALYQLRGRVGRSNRLAYAYFTTPAGRVLTEDAMKRLTAIMDYTDLGSGFKIAMRDLEIRGAGNVLGKEQHGHIEKVGYDMYCKLLQEAVEEISGSKSVKASQVEMQVNIDAYLDSEYISSANEKIKIYKEIAEIQSEDNKKQLINKLTENYGKPAKSMLNLLEIAYIKNLASMCGAKKVVINERGAGIVFDANIYKNADMIILISKMENECVLSGDTYPMLVFNVKTKSIYEKIAIIENFLLNASKKD